MHCKSQLPNSIVWAIAWAAAVALLVLLAVATARAQNPVPPTAREAAASPAFASRLHPARRPARKKPWAPANARGRFASPQSPSCANRYSPDCGGGPPYDNGPINGTADAWTINFGFIVSDTFVLSGTPVNSFDLGVWEFPGDVVSSLQWSITSSPNGGTVYGSGTVSGSNLTDTFISTNQFGYDIDRISATGLNVNVTSGSTYWVNVFNASVPSGDPVFWDENSGKGCGGSDGKGANCPSQAVESAFGTIPSEAFDTNGGGSPPPRRPACFQPGGGLQVIHDFTQQEAGPNGLTSDKAGNFYGTTFGGGANNAGMAYEPSSKGQGWMFNPLYSLHGGANGSGPSPVIIGPDDALYGAASGGIQNCGGGYCGLVFSLRPAPTACLTALCSWTESVLYEPTGSLDASNPSGLAFDQTGNLYGTSESGGTKGEGAVFELTPSVGTWTEKILYNFTGASDGLGPLALLVGNEGNLYGALWRGGTFQLVPSGGGWEESIINGTSGTLAKDTDGNLYGLTVAYDNGPQAEVFMLSPSSGSWEFSVLYESPPTLGGGYNLSGPAIDAAGNVYVGIGYYFYDPNGYGTAWGEVMMRPPGGNFSNLWFSGLYGYVQFPTAGPLALDASSNVYGTTSNCGKYDHGTLWKV